jgi:hypothetical protein
MKGPDMAAPRIVLSLTLAIGSVGALQTTAFAGEYRGTWEQQMACTPDVWRLCSSQVPDVNRIVGCLRQNTELLSGPCRAVFESNNNVPAPPRGRIAPAPRRPDLDDE